MAVYDPVGEALTLDFKDGSRATIKAGTGDEA